VQQQHPQTTAQQVEILHAQPAGHEGQGLPVDAPAAGADQRSDLDGLNLVGRPLRRVFSLVDDARIKV
jgi:hypothetical protein